MDRRIVAAIMGVGALLLVAGAYTSGWFTAGKGSRSIGVNLWGSVEMCRRGECKSQAIPMSAAKGKAKMALVMGKIGFIASLLGAGLLGLLAVFVFTKNPNELQVAKVTNGVVSTAASCGLMFIILMDAGRGMSIGYSIFLFFIGAGGGIYGATMSMKGKLVDVAGGGIAPGGYPMQPGMQQGGYPQQPGMQQGGYPQQPGMQQPGMQQPGMQQPGMQQPGMQQPGMQQPGMQQPGMQQPGMQQQQQPQMAAAPAQQQAQCGKCGGASRWVPEYSRYWCDACQAYV